MFYFKFNIGDYTSHTQHLSIIEDIAYRRMLEAYYLSERPLNSGIASVARQIRMREHEAEVETVLREFFNLTDDGWVHARADREIADYHDKSEQASKAGKASARKRLNGRSTDVQPTTNHKPLTIKQEPSNTGAFAPPGGVSPSVWQDFQKLRKSKKAPVTQTAIDGIKREADKAGITLEAALAVCCQRGWTGFKADWMAQPVNRNDVAAVTVPSNAAELTKIAANERAKGVVAMPPEIRSKLAEFTGRIRVNTDLPVVKTG